MRVSLRDVGGGLDGLGQLRALMASGRKPGTVHVGYAATLLDSACGCAVHSQPTSTTLLIFEPGAA